VDVRILSATHKNLSRLVEEGRFRQDLFYRVNVIELQIPPLRDRREDLPLLIDYILGKLSEGSGTPLPALADEAREALYTYYFPGNVRELENILERALTLCDGKLIRREDLQLPVYWEKVPAHAGGDVALDDYLGDVEKQSILQALEKTRWNKTAAARRLGISLRALRYRLEKLGLD